MNQNKNQNINVTQRRRNRNRIGLNRHATTNRMTTKIVWFHSYLILIVYDWVSSQPNHHNRAHASTECSKTNFFSSCTPIIRTIRTVRVRAACQRCIFNLKSMKKWTLLEPTECVPLFITVIEIDLDFYSFLYTPISSAPSRSNFIIGLWMAAVKKSALQIILWMNFRSYKIMWPTIQCTWRHFGDEILRIHQYDKRFSIVFSMWALQNVH